MGLSSYKELIVWQKSILLVDAVYALTRKLPKEEQFGLVSQIRRAAISVASNIAEGYRRQYTPEFRQFVSIAFGSAAELETQLIIAKRQYPRLEPKLCEELLDEVLKMLNVLQSKLK